MPQLNRKAGHTAPPGHQASLSSAPGRMTAEAGVAFRRPPFVVGGHDKEECRIAVPPASNEPRINDRIRAREVLLVDSDGTKLGVRTLPDALQLAREQDLDLVEVASAANPPVCRIMDYGKWRFDQTQRAKESRRKTTQAQIKEMKYRVKIGPGDFDTKTRKVVEFLNEGHKVKITIMFRGRETAHPHLGKNILDRIADQASGFAKVEAAPKLDGRNMIMVLAPDKRAQQQMARAKQPSSEPVIGDDGAAEPNGINPPPSPSASTAEPAAAEPAAAEPTIEAPATRAPSNPQPPAQET
ncbi:MAG TPA: translation initiation factor IF-3 [Acidimicrobiales bacterium]